MTIQTVLESDVNAIVAKAAAFVAGVENAAEIVVEDVDTFFQWLAGEAPTITAAVQTVTGLVGEMQAANVPLPSSLAGDLADLNAAVAGLNAAAQATNSGSNPAQAVIAGYVAAKSVAATTATLSSTVVSGATPVQPAAVAASTASAAASAPSTSN